MEQLSCDIEWRGVVGELRFLAAFLLQYFSVAMGRSNFGAG